MPLLEARRVTKKFGGLVAVKNVDLAIEENTIAALIGPNGAGKTTLFNVLTGLYHPDEGEIRFERRALRRLRPDKITRAGICRTFQNIRLFGEMTVLDNVLVGMHARIPLTLADVLLRPLRKDAEEARARDRALELLDLVGLAGGEASSAPAPDRARPRGASQAPAARRANGRHESVGGADTDGIAQEARRLGGAQHSPDRAQHARRHGHLGPRRRARSRREDRRRRAGRRMPRRPGHRGVSRKRKVGGRCSALTGSTFITTPSTRCRACPSASTRARW